MQGSGDRCIADIFASLPVEIDRPHLDQIDDPFESGFKTDRHLYGDGVVRQLFTQVTDHFARISPRAVQFIDESQCRYFVTFHLAINGNGLTLHSSYAAKHKDGTIKHAQ